MNTVALVALGLGVCNTAFLFMILQKLNERGLFEKAPKPGNKSKFIR